MNWLEGFLLWIANFQIFGNHANIIGFLWLLVLTTFIYSRFKGLFKKCYSLRCGTCNFSRICCPNSNRNKVWHFTILSLSAYITFFFQMLLDDTITTPINLIFGSWELRQPVLGAFSVYNLWLTKFDVYLMIMLFALVFWVKGFHQFFHFTKYSIFWLSLVLFFSIIIAQTHWWTHLRFEGDMRILVFWLSYPEFRVLTGFFVASLIKKPLK